MATVLAVCGWDDWTRMGQRGRLCGGGVYFAGPPAGGIQGIDILIEGMLGKRRPWEEARP